MIEINGCANIITMIDLWEQCGDEPELNEIRRQAKMTIEYLRQLENPKGIRWHDIAKKHEAEYLQPKPIKASTKAAVDGLLKMIKELKNEA